jgi:hypothetical protein
VGLPLGRRHAGGRVRRGDGTLARRAPPVHSADGREHRDLQDRPGRRAGGGATW